MSASIPVAIFGLSGPPAAGLLREACLLALGTAMELQPACLHSLTGGSDGIATDRATAKPQSPRSDGTAGAPEPEPEPTHVAAFVVHEPEPTLPRQYALALSMPEAVLNSDVEAKRRGWLAMMEHINCVGRYTLPEYEAVFGRVEVSHPYGHGFWVGFEKIMADYLRFHLYWHRVEHLTKGYFRKPYPFSKNTAQLPYEKRLQEGDSEFPCFFVQTQPGWYTMVCINICIWTSRPWIVHYTWIRVAVAI